MSKNLEDIQRIRLELNLTQEELAKKLNLSRQFICNVEKGIKKLNSEKYKELLNIYYSSYPHLKEKYVDVEFLNQEKLTGKIVQSADTISKASLSTRLLQEDCENFKYGSFVISTASMEPTLKSGSRIIFQYQESSQIIDNEIYIFYYKDELFIRRLSKNLDEIIVSSDNKNHKDIFLKNSDFQYLDIVGKVVAVIF